MSPGILPQKQHRIATVPDANIQSQSTHHRARHEAPIDLPVTVIFAWHLGSIKAIRRARVHDPLRLLTTIVPKQCFLATRPEKTDMGVRPRTAQPTSRDLLPRIQCAHTFDANASRDDTENSCNLTPDMAVGGLTNAARQMACGLDCAAPELGTPRV